MTAAPVTFTVWSDSLCPWCYVTAVRLHAVRQDAGDALRVVWRSFLLRPSSEARPLDAFRRYTESWRRPAAAESDAVFRVWAGDTAPPSHSMPCAIAGKAALSFGADAFDRFHLGLMRAYFGDNRTISDRSVILDVAVSAGLDAAAFGARLGEHSGQFEADVIADHKDALARGIAAVPTVVVGTGDDEYVLTGAMTTAQYLKVVSRLAS